MEMTTATVMTGAVYQEAIWSQLFLGSRLPPQNGYHNEVFMEIVRTFPILYDRFSKDFKDKHKKNNAWNQVAEATQIPVEECIKKYKNIRTNYVRHMKKRKPSGSGRTSEDSVNSSCNFQWLDTFIEHRKTFTNLSDTESTQSSCEITQESVSTASSHDLDEDEDSDNNNDIESATNISVSPETVLPSVGDAQGNSKRSTNEENAESKRPWAKGSKKAKKSDIDNAFLKTINSFEKSISSHVHNANEKSREDEDYLFCKSIAAQIKRLPAEKKGIAKVQILQMLQSFEFGASSTPASVPLYQVPLSAVNVPLSPRNIPFSQEDYGQHSQNFLQHYQKL